MSGLYIKRFIDKLQQLEAKGSRDFIIPIADAKNLHNDITKLLVDLQSMHDGHGQSPDEVIHVNIAGNDF